MKALIQALSLSKEFGSATGLILSGVDLCACVGRYLPRRQTLRAVQVPSSGPPAVAASEHATSQRTPSGSGTECGL